MDTDENITALSLVSRLIAEHNDGFVITHERSEFSRCDIGFHAGGFDRGYGARLMHLSSERQLIDVIDLKKRTDFDPPVLLHLSGWQSSVSFEALLSSEPSTSCLLGALDDL